MRHHPFLVALAAVIAVNVVVVVLAIATGIRRGLGGAWDHNKPSPLRLTPRSMRLNHPIHPGSILALERSSTRPLTSSRFGCLTCNSGHPLVTQPGHETRHANLNPGIRNVSRVRPSFFGRRKGAATHSC